MKGLSYLGVAVIASLVTVGVIAATGVASRSTSDGRYLTARVGDNVTFPGLDLFCNTESRDPDHRESGPIIFCTRDSAAGASRAMAASRYHMWISDPTGNYIAARYVRAP